MTSHAPCAAQSCAVCRLFGAHKNTKSKLGPSRIIVRDGRLRSGGQIENKTENVINRQSGAAQHPRSNERVVEGTEFNLQIVLQVFDLDRDFSYKDLDGVEHQGDVALQGIVLDSLKLVQLTGLGGGTSRGSGAVSFRDFKTGWRVVGPLVRLRLRLAGGSGPPHGRRTPCSGRWRARGRGLTGRGRCIATF